jgi:hypothetical protein
MSYKARPWTHKLTSLTVRGKIREACSALALPQIPNVLVKVVLISGAVPLPPDPNYVRNGATGDPVDFSGFGRVNIAKSLIALRDDLQGCGFWPKTAADAAINVQQGQLLFPAPPAVGGPALPPGIRVTVPAPVAWQSHNGFMPQKKLTVTMCFADFGGGGGTLHDCYGMVHLTLANAPEYH